MKIILHPALTREIDRVIGLDNAKVCAETVLTHEVFVRVSEIVEKQPIENREGLYKSIIKSAMAGSDYSQVETFDDLAVVYAEYLLKQFCDDN